MAKTTWIKGAAWVVAWDGDEGRHYYLRDADVVFAGNTITHVGKNYAGPADEVIDGWAACVMPGLIDIHSHPYGQPLHRGFSEELANPTLYMDGFYDLKVAYFPDEDGARTCFEVAVSELLLSGVTTIVAIAVPQPDWVETVAKSGVRGYIAPIFRSAQMYSKNGHEVVYEWNEPAGRKAFDEALRIVEAAMRHPSGRISGVIAPAQLDTCTPELLRDAIAVSVDKGLPFTTHAAQAIVEFLEMTRRHGKTPIQWADEIGILKPNSIIAHAIFIDEHSWVHWSTRRDLRILAESGCTVAHCPGPYARYGQTLENFGRYLRAGVNMAIGTDSHPHNLLEELRWTAILARVAGEGTFTVSTAEVFQAATVGAARALGRADIGRLAVGAKADIVLVDLDHPLMKPLRDPLRNLIYTAQDRAVRDVYVDGIKLVDNRRVKTINYPAAAERMQEVQRRAMHLVPSRDRANRSLDDLSPITLPIR